MHSFPTILNSNNGTLLEIANLTGIDLGVSLEMEEHNIELVRSQERARMAFLGEKSKNNNTIAEPLSEDLHPGDVDAILKELLAFNNERMYEDIENLNLLGIGSPGLSSGLINKISKETYCVKTPVRTVSRRRKTNKKKC